MPELKLSGSKYIEAHKHSSGHRASIEASSEAGCFYCTRTFPANSVKEWVDSGTTALCPHCGIDSVIGDATGIKLGESFLSLMHDCWFGETHEEDELKAAHDRKWRHRTLIEDSNLCGCFYCITLFDKSYIKEWIRTWEGGGMALCPFCGIDSVMGSKAPFNMMFGFLRAMNRYWFKDADRPT